MLDLSLEAYKVYFDAACVNQRLIDLGYGRTEKTHIMYYEEWVAWKKQWLENQKQPVPSHWCSAAKLMALELFPDDYRLSG